MALHGYDIANVNGTGIITKALTGSFVIVKATEGLTFKDKLMPGFVQQIRARGLLLGYYHFAHPANSATAEADEFVNYAQPRDGEVMVLDFEPYGQGVPVSRWPGWILAFLDRVKARTGAECWLYINNDQGTQLVNAATPAQAQALRTWPLWKAAYGSSMGSTMGWPAVTAWQYNADGIDKNWFYGTPATWRMLGAGVSTPEETAVALTNDDAEKVWSADVIPTHWDTSDDATNPTWTAKNALGYIGAWALAARDRITDVRKDIAGVQSTLTAVSSTLGAIRADVQAARAAADKATQAATQAAAAATSAGQQAAGAASAAREAAAAVAAVQVPGPQQVQDAARAGLQEIITSAETTVVLKATQPGE